MPSAKTLQSMLSHGLLQKLAGMKVFERGNRYYNEDCVTLLYHAHTEAAAEVMGSQPYRVEITHTPEGLQADCTCPAMFDYGFCKHAVALGLFLIDASSPSPKTPLPEIPDYRAADDLVARVYSDVVKAGNDI